MARRKLYPERLVVTLREGVTAQLDAIAEAQHLDRLAIIRRLINEGLERHAKAVDPASKHREQHTE